MTKDFEMLRDIMAKSYCKRLKIKIRGLHLLSGNGAEFQTNKTRITSFLDGWDACDAIRKKEIEALEAQLHSIKNDLKNFIQANTDDQNIL